ncbi:hypothetical protein AB0M92_18750 [Streptomyces sp. NPDC051582]|uniref:DUF6197 family protein n=1 Tax=Streptomyces sp. NPDC051582 TaxID=3155167 RepID=UPI00342EDB5E
MKKSPAVILADAVEILRRNGHFKGGYYDPSTDEPALSEQPVCAIGAILIAAEGWPTPEMPGVFGETTYEAIKVLARSVYSTVVDEDPIERIADWNDDADRTPGEVMQAMTRAAEEWAA